MKKECYDAKQWLKRTHKLALRVEADKRFLEILADRINQAVAKYETDGTATDRDSARKRREDEMLEYTEQRDHVEQEQLELIAEMTKTRNIVKSLNDPTLEAVAVNRYVNRLQWDDIIKLTHYSRSQVFRFHLKMLEELAKVLQEEKII